MVRWFISRNCASPVLVVGRVAGWGIDAEHLLVRTMFIDDVPFQAIVEVPIYLLMSREEWESANKDIDDLPF